MPKKLGEMLIHCGLLDETQLAAALEAQHRNDLPLGMTLLRMGLVGEEALVSILARQLRLPVACLRDWRVHPDLLDLVPRELAEKHRVLPLSVREDGPRRLLYLAVADPSDLGGVDEVAERTGMQIRVVLVGPSELESAIYRWYGGAAYPDDPGPFEAREGAAGAAARRSERWSISTEELFALLSDGAAPEDGSARNDGAATPESTQRRLEELDAIVGVLASLLIEAGVASRADLADRLRRRLAPPTPARDAA